MLALQWTQGTDSPYSVDERAFISKVALPRLNGIKDVRIAEKLAEDFWNFCGLEIDRVKILDTKASALLGLSSIAAAVVSVGAVGSSSQLQIWLRCGSIFLFLITVVLCLVALIGRIYGALIDEEVFSSIDSNKVRRGRRHRFTRQESILMFSQRNNSATLGSLSKAFRKEQRQSTLVIGGANCFGPLCFESLWSDCCCFAEINSTVRHSYA